MQVHRACDVVLRKHMRASDAACGTSVKDFRARGVDSCAAVQCSACWYDTSVCLGCCYGSCRVVGSARRGREQQALCAVGQPERTGVASGWGVCRAQSS
jgi:hypothetical protein